MRSDVELTALKNCYQTFPVRQMRCLERVAVLEPVLLSLQLCVPILKRALYFFPLRYMMQWPGGRILQRHELDAFLAQAVSSQLYEPDQLQELKVRLHSLIVG